MNILANNISLLISVFCIAFLFSSCDNNSEEYVKIYEGKITGQITDFGQSPPYSITRKIDKVKNPIKYVPHGGDDVILIINGEQLKQTTNIFVKEGDFEFSSRSDSNYITIGFYIYKEYPIDTKIDAHYEIWGYR